MRRRERSLSYFAKCMDSQMDWASVTFLPLPCVYFLILAHDALSDFLSASRLATSQRLLLMRAGCPVKRWSNHCFQCAAVTKCRLLLRARAMSCGAKKKYTSTSSHWSNERRFKFTQRGCASPVAQVSQASVLRPSPARVSLMV